MKKLLLFVLILQAHASIVCSTKPFVNTKNVTVIPKRQKGRRGVEIKLTDHHSKNINKVVSQAKTLPKKVVRQTKRLTKHVRKFKF